MLQVSLVKISGKQIPSWRSRTFYSKSWIGSKCGGRESREPLLLEVTLASFMAVSHKSCQQPFSWHRARMEVRMKSWNISVYHFKNNTREVVEKNTEEGVPKIGMHMC